MVKLLKRMSEEATMHKRLSNKCLFLYLVSSRGRWGFLDVVLGRHDVWIVALKVFLAEPVPVEHCLKVLFTTRAEAGCEEAALPGSDLRSTSTLGDGIKHA